MRSDLLDAEPSRVHRVELLAHGLYLARAPDDRDRDLMWLRRMKGQLEDQREGDREQEREPQDRCDVASGRDRRGAGSWRGSFGSCWRTS